MRSGAYAEETRVYTPGGDVHPSYSPSHPLPKGQPSVNFIDRKSKIKSQISKITIIFLIIPIYSRLPLSFPG